MGFIDEIKAKAKSCKKTIVLPESEDIRTYEAAEAILKEGTANLILIGSEEEIAKNKGDFDITGATIVDPATYEKTDEYVATLVELRKKKGMTEEQAREILLTNYLYYGVMMVKMKDADGMVSGDILAEAKQINEDRAAEAEAEVVDDFCETEETEETAEDTAEATEE